MFTLLAWLHAFLPLIAHWSIAAALIGGAVAVTIFVPNNLVRMAAIAVAAGTIVGIVEYSAGDRDGAARITTQWNQAKAAEAKKFADQKAKADAAELMLNAATSTLNDTVDQLEKAREDALAKTPAPADCTDSPADVDGLRRLIRGQ